MTLDSRLSGVLHALLHMAEKAEPSTSEELARAMSTNPVVLRRLMSGLRDAGFVASAKGHGGGWVMVRPLTDITLGDVHEAVGAPTLLAVGHRDTNPRCLVEQAVNAALDTAYRDAESLLLERLHAVTLDQLSRDFHRRFARSGHQHHESHHSA